METALIWIGVIVVMGFLVRTFAHAIRTSGLKEFSLQFRFKEDEKPQKQLSK